MLQDDAKIFQPKFCVFCGSKPNKKTKEHIIPKWLIELTGDPNREINLGIDTALYSSTGKLKMRKYRFSSFHFPACYNCNKEFSELEGKAKIIVKKILLKERLVNTEINTLLDWFDKVRTGLWLGTQLLDRQMLPISPKFYIKSRVAKKDRYLLMYEFMDNWQGVQFTGFNSPVFLISPSCISLSINNYKFISISSDFLFSQNIGFPFPIKHYIRARDIKTYFDFVGGLETIKLPLISKPFIEPSIEIFQPVIPIELVKKSPLLEQFYNTKYIKDNCMNFEKGLGDIFYIDNNELLKLSNNMGIRLSHDHIKTNRLRHMDGINKYLFNTQLELYINQIPSTENLTTEEAIHANDENNMIIRLQKEFMRTAKLL